MCHDVVGIINVFVHVDGVHNSTKKNRMLAKKSFSLITLQDDMVTPHCGTSKPSENSNHVFKIQLRSSVTTVWRRAYVYGSTPTIDSNVSNCSFIGGPVRIERDPELIKTLK